MVPMPPSGAQECRRGVQEPLCWSQHGMGWNGMEWDGMKSIIQNLCQILQHRSPRAVKISPGGSQNRGWGRPREPRCIQKVLKTSPEGPKRRPRGAQEAFKSAQEMSKRRLRGPRRLQTPSKIKPGKVRNIVWQSSLLAWAFLEE